MDKRFKDPDYEKKAKVWVVVAAHKDCVMPGDRMYIPLHVGAEGKLAGDGTPLDLGFQKDNTGENISALNSQFCELTGLYWAWKNLSSEYLGLAHYRRHFRGKKRKKNKYESILRYRELRPMLNGARVIVPKKRRYYIETLYSHYEHTHHIEELDTAREILEERYPEYLPSYERVMRQNWGYMFNMMIMKKDLVDEYCTWIFDILFDLVERLKGREGLTDFDLRYPGRVSELFFNVWLARQVESGRIKKEEIREVPFVYTEKINYRQKVVTFLTAKFFHKKFRKSA